MAAKERIIEKHNTLLNVEKITNQKKNSENDEFNCINCSKVLYSKDIKCGKCELYFCE